MTTRTYHAKPGEVPRRWLVVDLEGKTLGRAATVIANHLRGKHKPQFTPHVDVGDFVVAINASKVQLTGNKLTTKRYFRHTGYPGGIRSASAGEVLKATPHRLLESAVKGMLPKTSLGRQLLRKLKIYAGPEHPHKAQQPTALEI